MRIVHISDSHWTTTDYPAADLYVHTGDALRNYPVKKLMAYSVDWEIDPTVEKIKQKLAMESFAKSVGMRQFLGNPDAPIVCVRGNHDFVPIAPLFAGCNLVHEFVDNEVVELDVAGTVLRITGHRGVPWIGGDRPGCWNDEVSRPELIERFKRMDMGCDLYLTHYTPDGAFKNDGYGLEEVMNHIEYNCTTKHPLWMMGHIHECGGWIEHYSNVYYSNAATTFNVIEGDPETGWKLTGKW